MPKIDPLTLWLLGAGMAGSFLHAWVTFNRNTWTKQTIVQTVLGGLGGLLLASVPYFNDLKPWGQVVAAVTTCYAASDLVINCAQQIGARLPGYFGGKIT